MKPIDISVIIPTYNAAADIGRCVESVLSQTLPPKEIIVVDDGSTDETPAIVKKYSDVRYIHQTNRGPSAARNLGIRLAGAAWIAFCDSDDAWLPNKLQEQIAILADANIGFCATDGMYEHSGDSSWHQKRVSAFRESGPAKQSITLEHWISHRGIYPSGILVRKDLLVKNGGFDETTFFFEDFILWASIISQTKAVFLNKALFKRYYREKSLSHGNSYKQRLAQIKAFERSASLFPEHSRAIKKQWVISSYALVRTDLHRGQIAPARKRYLEILSRDIFFIRHYIKRTHDLLLFVRKFAGQIILGLSLLLPARLTKSYFSRLDTWQ